MMAQAVPEPETFALNLTGTTTLIVSASPKCGRKKSFASSTVLTTRTLLPITKTYCPGPSEVQLSVMTLDTARRAGARQRAKRLHSGAVALRFERGMSPNSLDFCPKFWPPGLTGGDLG
jgi:hypothetical protein